MKRLLLAALVAASAACRKAPAEEAKDPVPAVAVVAGEKLIAFDERHGAFSCRVPAAWKAMEDRGTGGPLLMMFGTMSGPLRGKVVLSVDRYDGAHGPVTTPQGYWEALRVSGQQPSPLETRQVGGRTVYALHLTKAWRPPHGGKALYQAREDVVLVPSGRDFFELSHAAPADAYQETLPLFDALVDSFAPKP